VALGGGTAAAVNQGWWGAHWTDDPDYSFEYDLPSGRTCLAHIGSMEGLSDEEHDAWGEWAGSTDLFALADVDRQLLQLRTDGYSVESPDGTLTKVRWGDPDYYNDTHTVDSEFDLAVSYAIAEVYREWFQDQGFTPTASEGAGQCEEAE
jgi:hypothetical protein